METAVKRSKGWSVMCKFRMAAVGVFLAAGVPAIAADYDASGAGVDAVALEDATRPNIIYINADDLGVMDVQFMRRKEYRTSNLDRLAAEGMVFTEAYAPSANCAPSRACCMSGQYTPRHGVYTVGNPARGDSKYRKLIPVKNTQFLTDKMVIIPEALKAAGYKTIHLGKWHVSKDPMTQGFDANIGGDHSGAPSGGYFTPFKKGPMAMFDDQYPAKTHMDDIFSDQAVKFLRENKNTTFFMHMAYYAVHVPLQPVPEYTGNYKNMPGIDPVYASMVEKMDESIGKIIGELDRLGMKENTVVLFTSDNGGVEITSKQTPYRAGKGSYFDGGIRVPLLVRWPNRIQAGSRCSVPVIGLDFFPTFLEAAKVPVPPGKILDGVSLMPLLTQSGTIPGRALYWHFPVYLQGYGDKGMSESQDPLFRSRPGSALRSGRWKLFEYYEDGRMELYDLEKDMGERQNLAVAMPDKAAELRDELQAWRKRMHAPVPHELNPDYDKTADMHAQAPDQ